MTDNIELVLQSQRDEQVLAALVRQYEWFILKTASDACKHSLTKSDDEWSVALQGFAEAVKSYRPEKGSFTGLAQLVIRRRLVDYIRSQAKHRGEIATDPRAFDVPSDEPGGGLAIHLAAEQRVRTEQQDSLRLEIEAANLLFRQYGFSFFDLAEYSPKAQKTKAACKKAVVFLLKNPSLTEEMRRLRQLPVKNLERSVQIPRKILDRHRKYIIAAAELLSGEYPCLAYYMRDIREELDR
jgi:RNA polymerase sigma factor